MHLNKEETRFLGKWAKAKRRGQWHYILTRGLLWGMLLAIVSQLLKVWDVLKAWDTAALADAYTSSDFFVRFFIYSAIGLGIFAYHWNSNTKRYIKLKNLERRSQADAVAPKQ
ncbi:hypothetical protein H9Q13_14140 [Pontibacter sp. JH31]|uniref:Uncharacterized protein n=1 Tax=Pontibacter aquaedesilientis TaxID=2766980 RepID=A0ABR7XJ67_9BACT|nr:hypothetical protein [Pontibacter aquaedesilientis]MBD1398307.1 hypothetical protein [Pontibacter aquaedesilientis]